MKITEAAKHFGNRSKLARALGITPSAVYMRQKACGDELPEEWAMKLHFATKGKLKFSLDEIPHSANCTKVSK